MSQKNRKAFVSWSGGKEISLAFYRVMKKGNIKASCLLNMVSSDGRHSRSHGVSAKLLRAQAEAIGISIVQRKTTWKNYEKEFKNAVSDLKRKGIGVGIFGDIDLQGHRDWVERVCKEVGIESILPLWNEKKENLLKEFIHAGFKAIVVATSANYLDKGWCGRQINKKFIKDLDTLRNIDLCGENGEFHTFVTDGPIFKKKIEFIKTSPVMKRKYDTPHWFLEIQSYKLT